MGAKTEQKTTRFERVTEILRDAAGGKAKAFGGVPLWDLSRERFLEASIEGLRLIAPESHGSCCGHEESAGTVSRSTKSALLLGLRGLPPFDGSRFPRFPWGEAAVADENIEFIADWVDDGCPADREIASFPVGELTSSPERVTIERVPELEASAKEYSYRPGELKQRVNIDCMSEAQLEKLRRAFRELYRLNRWPEDSRNYNNLALIHQNHCQHGWERFLPWHRVYLYEFEQAMQDQCPDVTMPYWDWTMPQYRPERPQDGWRIPKALQAFLTEASLEYLGRQRIPTKPLESLLGKSYPSLCEFFKPVKEKIGEEYTKDEHRKRFIDALLEANSLWYPLRFPGEFFQNGSKTTINKRIHYHYPSPADIQQILSLRSFRDFGGGSLYNDAFGFLDQNPHNTMHIWTGGMNPAVQPAPPPADRNRGVRVAGRKFHKLEDLYSQPEHGDMFSNLTASYDPVFWPVHANVDRLWWEWQERHPESLPRELDAVLTPWSYTIGDTLDMHRFGYEYVKACHVIPVGLEQPVGRFVSHPIEVDERVRAGFEKAEVRLHRIPQLPRSCFIRCFLNLPEADAHTGMDRDEYAGYLAVFGHGACYGGPGHCDIPPRTRRPYDLRPRSHNTPRNHRIDVTRSARKLFDKGAKALQLTLVVIGADYEEDRELLRLEGVSLNFLD